LTNPFNYPKIKPKIEGDLVPKKIQDILIGCLLGDCGGEMQKNGINPCFAFKQSIIHIDYIFYLYFIFLHWGYVQPFAIPLIRNTRNTRGNVHKYLRFRTITSPNLLSIYNLFYNTENGIRLKRVPSNLELLLTPRALALWIMDDGSKDGSGILLHTNSFKYEEVLYLIKRLKEKYRLECVPRKNLDKHIIYIKAISMPMLIKIVVRHIHPHFYYKLGIN
jgi:ubiquinol-cytochrome c reductase cytochrome b subunit